MHTNIPRNQSSNRCVWYLQGRCTGLKMVKNDQDENLAGDGKEKLEHIQGCIMSEEAREMLSWDKHQVEDKTHVNTIFVNGLGHSD